MNGRIYDPVIGRFLSADVLVQFPGNLQSYNRYSYVQNNPLTYNDPSGHFIPLIIGGVVWLTAGEAAVVGTAVVSTAVLSNEKTREASASLGRDIVDSARAAITSIRERASEAKRSLFGDERKDHQASATVSPVSGDGSTAGVNQGSVAEEKAKEGSTQAGGVIPAGEGVGSAAPVPAGPSGIIEKPAGAGQSESGTVSQPPATAGEGDVEKPQAEAVQDDDESSLYKPKTREQAEDRMGGEDDDPWKGKRPPKGSKERDRDKQERHDRKESTGRGGRDNPPPGDDWY